MKENVGGKGFGFLRYQFPTGISVLATLGVMALLIACVYGFNIPNPNMVLIAGLVVCSATFGYAGGLTATAVMVAYTLYFFSEGNSFVTFTPQNLTKVWVSLFGILVDMVFVSELKRRSVRAFREVEALSEELRSDNDQLQQISVTDGLTGIKNRLGLRRDFEGYFNRDVFVIMLDVDNFKEINDSFGHEKGDYFLAQTGRLLADIFGAEACYRYGGDEFMVICPNRGEPALRAKLDELIDRRPSQEVGAWTVRVDYSYGYASAFIHQRDDLRGLFAAADQRMYRMKNSKKHTA